MDSTKNGPHLKISQDFCEFQSQSLLLCNRVHFNASVKSPLSLCSGISVKFSIDSLGKILIQSISDTINDFQRRKGIKSIIK